MLYVKWTAKYFLENLEISFINDISVIFIILGIIHPNSMSWSGCYYVGIDIDTSKDICLTQILVMEKPISE